MATTDEELASEARRQTARAAYDKATNADNIPAVRRDGWRELWQFQKTCKKGWDKLGFSTREIDRIKLNKPDWL